MTSEFANRHLFQSYIGTYSVVGAEREWIQTNICFSFCPLQNFKNIFSNIRLFIKPLLNPLFPPRSYPLSRLFAIFALNFLLEYNLCLSELFVFLTTLFIIYSYNSYAVFQIRTFKKKIKKIPYLMVLISRWAKPFPGIIHTHPRRLVLKNRNSAKTAMVSENKCRLYIHHQDGGVRL